MPTTFTPKNDSLAERISAYIRVQRDFDNFTRNTYFFDSETLGEEKEVYEAHALLRDSLTTAFASIELAELTQAREMGLLSESSVRAFMQNKRKFEASDLVKERSHFTSRQGQQR